MLLNYTLPHMTKLLKEGGTHVLFVDGVDSIFISGIEEIAAKYERHWPEGATIISADWDGTPHGVFTGPKPWKYLNGGGYLTPIEPWVEMMERFGKKYPQEGNYQVWLEKEWPISGCFLDHDCRIFQSMNGNRAVVPMGSRVLNTVTESWPCILHFRGGYCDPQTGREERIKPWLEALVR